MKQPQTQPVTHFNTKQQGGRSKENPFLPAETYKESTTDQPGAASRSGPVRAQSPLACLCGRGRSRVRGPRLECLLPRNLYCGHRPVAPPKARNAHAEGLSSQRSSSRSARPVGLQGGTVCSQTARGKWAGARLCPRPLTRRGRQLWRHP